MEKIKEKVYSVNDEKIKDQEDELKRINEEIAYKVDIIDSITKEWLEILNGASERHDGLDKVEQNKVDKIMEARDRIKNEMKELIKLKTAVEVIIFRLEMEDAKWEDELSEMEGRPN